MLSSTQTSKLLVLARQARSADYLGQRQFLLAILAAFALHVAALVAWHLMPHVQVVDVPVRVLNIKLGDGDTVSPEELKALQPPAGNAIDVDNTISHLVRDPQDEQVRTQSVVGMMDKAMGGAGKEAAPQALDKAIAGSAEGAVQKLSNIARQFVRENALPAKTSVAGTSGSKDAEMVSRYEQLISLWIQKFKVYPVEARAAGMQGETMVRIRIDRQGNIRYYILENSTGYQMLDRAAVDMIRRANPVPAVPIDYPPGELIEFLIPVSFRLQ